MNRIWFFHLFSSFGKNILWVDFLKRIFIWKAGWHRRRDSQIFYLQVHSLNVCISLAQTRLKTWYLLVSHTDDRGLVFGSSSAALPGTLQGEIQRGAAGTWYGAPIWDEGIASSALIACTTMGTPNSNYFGKLATKSGGYLWAKNAANRGTGAWITPEMYLMEENSSPLLVSPVWRWGVDPLGRAGRLVGILLWWNLAWLLLWTQIGMSAQLRAKEQSKEDRLFQSCFGYRFWMNDLGKSPKIFVGGHLSSMVA